MFNFYLKISLTLFSIFISVFIWTSCSIAYSSESFQEATVIYAAKPENITLESLPAEKPSWPATAWVLGTTILLYQNDQEIQDFFQENQSQSTHDISSLAEHFGNNAELIPSLGLFYLYGKVRKDEKSQHSALLSIESLFIATLFTNTIKLSTHRSRPNTGEAYNSWGGSSFDNNNHYLSFPSGHATSAFSVATVIATEYRDNPFIPGLSYSIASLTALSRVHENKHWASDIFLGSAIGYFTGKWVINLNNQNENTLTIVPVLQDRGYGLAVTYQF